MPTPLLSWQFLVKPLLLLLLSVALPLGATEAAPPKDLRITADRLIDQDLLVPAGGSLTVQPGVSLRFEPTAGIVISGSLVAEGTVDKPIRFTSAGAGTWLGIAVLAGGRIQLRRCRLSGGGGRSMVWDPDTGVWTGFSSGQVTIHPPTMGGVLFLQACQQAHLEHCRFDHDSADYGGALACTGGAAPVLSGCRFDDDQARLAGGAILWSGAGGSCTGCLIDGNHAPTGGGVRMVHGANAHLVACRLEGNQASDCGGAVSLEDGNHPLFQDCMFSGNAASNHGSAISALRDSEATLHGNWLENNTDRDANGIGLQQATQTGGRPDHSLCAQDEPVNRDRVLQRLTHAQADSLEQLLPDP